MKANAAAIVKNLIITDENYQEAWNKLIERFNKNYQIIIEWIRTFFDQPSSSNLNPQLCGLINELNNETKRLWPEKIYDPEFPTIDFFRNRYNSYFI